MNRRYKRNHKKPIRESKVTGNFHGIPKMKFVWYNESSDPGVLYKGKYLNANAIDDTLWDMFSDYCKETGVIMDQDMFDQWISENPYEVYEIADMMIENGAYEDIEEIRDDRGKFSSGWRSGNDFIWGESKARKQKKLKIQRNSIFTGSAGGCFGRRALPGGIRRL